MNLLYLPTIIALLVKYGAAIGTAETVLKDFTPAAQAFMSAVAPIVQKEVAGLAIDTTSAPSIVKGVQTVLQSLDHPALSPDEQDVLTNRLSQMS